METLSGEERRSLEEIYRRIEDRAAAIGGGRAWWPCRAGCDHCCRHLAEPLTITRLEWAYLWEGFQRLPPQTRRELRARVAGMARADAGRPYTCPLLDGATGRCRVYAHRPASCRSYGFYVSRDRGEWCHLVAELLDRHGDGDIVWGNQLALDEALERLTGERVSIFDWFAAHPAPEVDPAS